MNRRNFIYRSYSCLLLVICVLNFIYNCEAHGRLIEPPSRASAWRYGFQTPPDYNDHELYCGGFTRQWKKNGGKCGECGDAWDLPAPRPHENGGQWGQGVVVRTYLPGTEMTIRVELTASHMGYFEFRLCPTPSGKQACLDEHVLPIMSGSPSQPGANDLDTRFYPRNGSRIYEMKARLPDMLCNQCVLQWRYVAGNNWGMCDDGNGAVGCGPQEEFRSCSDIALTTEARLPIRPMRPTQRISTTTISTSTKSDYVEVNENIEDMSLIICLISLLLLLLFAGIGLLLYVKSNPAKLSALRILVLQKCRKKTLNSPLVNTAHNNKSFKPFVTIYDIEKSTVDNVSPLTDFPTVPPVPPPRTKRDSRTREVSKLDR
ncbi:uncharacterized protein LOC108602518 isoform X2 [Drosophila busckii]|nr:uncharacterized protein LOC108602518 isoform X2 [Drosophila busckii]